MNLDLHSDLSIHRTTLGRERAPLLVIDHFIADAEQLVEHAAAQTFTERSRYYPGIRANAPLDYETLVLTKLESALRECLDAPGGGSLRFAMCQYSLVTTPANRLAPPQRIPHVDSLSKHGLATIHYLFKANLGGTAFYRHRSTGFEYVDEARNATYVTALQNDFGQPVAIAPGYINGDTRQFEQINAQSAVFNRMLVYRRNSLHSGCIDPAFIPDPNPATGRLSINSFIDFVPQ